MFWKNDKASDSTLQLQVINYSPDMNPVNTSSPPTESQSVPLQNIDRMDVATEKAPKSRRINDPCSTAYESWVAFVLHSPATFLLLESFGYFTSENRYLHWQERLVTHHMILVQHRPDIVAHIPIKTSAFKFVANFPGFSTGHYTIGWRVKATKDFCIPNGLHFVVNVSYDTEPDISGTLDVIMPAHKLNMLVKERWYNLVLEEKLVIQPHIGKSRVQVILRNNENVERVDFFGFVIEHVEIRPISLPKENQVWDMSVVKNPNNPNKGIKNVYSGCATVAIDHIGVGDLPIGLSISSNGDQVAIFQEPKIGEWAEGSNVEKATFPFKLFNNPLVPQSSFVLNIDTPSDNNANEKTATVPADNSFASNIATPIEPMQLTEVRSNYGILRTFIGYGQFLPEMKKGDWEKNDVNSALNSTADGEGEGGDARASSSKNSASQMNSMFVACNGLYLDAFEISSEKKWKRKHTITLADLLPTLSRRITCKLMMESISSGTFMWLEDGGRSCTIWNLLTGSNITHISSIENAAFKGPTFRGHSKMAISPHESIVALASVDGSLTTYFANTGMAIDDINFPGYKIEYVGFHSQDDQLFVILRNSTTFELTAKILDTLQLKSQTMTNQVPIPSIGQTILAFFYTKGFWNRGIICEPDAAKINFYISYQPTSSKVAKGNPKVVKASPDDVVYESRHHENIQYRLMTGIHRELLPEGDGVSYWVLRVEVVEEDLEKRSQRVIFSFVPEPWMRISTSEVSHPENLQSVFFVPCGTRFAVVGVQTLQIWNLPTRENPKCSLQFFWSQPRDEDSFESGDIEHKSGRVRDYYMETQGITIFMDTETSNTTAEVKMNDKFRKLVVPLPGIGTISARLAILHCFRSIHLLAAAFAFSHRESAKVARTEAQVTFTYEEHCDAIVRFTREHINRMMSIGVYSPKKRRLSPAISSQPNPSRPRKDKGDELADPDTPKPDDPDSSRLADPDTTKLADLDTIKPVASTIGEARKPTIIGENITIHANANRHDDDDHDQDDRIRPAPKRVKHKHVLHGRSGGPKPRNSEVVTILTLLLDHPYLQRANHIFVEGLLNTANGDWIPRDNKVLNPIKRAIEARNGQLVMAFIDYCIKNAKKYHPSYLMPAVQCLNELSDRYPTILADMFRRASYVPAHNHVYVSSHAIIANPQMGSWLAFKLKFWNMFLGKKWEKSNIVNDYQKPVFSLRSQLPFRASSRFNVLSIETSARERRVERFPPKMDMVMEKEREMKSEYSHKIYVAPFPKLSMYGPYRPWFKDLAKAKSAFVEIAGQDYFDSPAMIATLAFKWHKFGFKFWLLRFSVAMIFFVLVIIITARQIYTSTLPDPITDLTYSNLISRYLDDDGWPAVIMTTIGIGSILVIYEFLQFLDSPRNYVTSPYNYTDLAAYVTPIIGCILLVRQDPNPDPSQEQGPSQVWVMSFAILFLYMNILFELRVIRELGIVVNIILNITRRIVWFFLIFALFLAGRWDPVDTSFDNNNASFHIMMVIFFFFTTILLLNILIALMNDAFNESKDQGQLVWLKQWSEVIAEVEVFLMTQSTRQNRNYFPDFIYYGASEQEAELYESKFSITDKSNLSIENRYLVETLEDEQSAAQQTQRALLRDVQALTKELKGMKQTQDGFNNDLTKITELMAAFIAQTSGMSPLSPRTEPSSQVSPIENDPHPSNASPTTPPGTAVGTPSTPGGFGLATPGGSTPGGASKFAAAAQRRAGGTLNEPTIPASVRRKISPSAPQTESPTAYSPLVQFNPPRSSTQSSTATAELTSLSGLPGREATTLPMMASSSAPYRVGSVPEPGASALDGRTLAKQRIQQKLAEIHTMDDALRGGYRSVEDNNASHPIYVKAPDRRLNDDDMLYDSDEERVETEIRKMTPVHHQTYYASSSSSHQHQDMFQYHFQTQSQSETHEHPKRTQSDTVVPVVPHETIPLHARPPQASPEDPPRNEDRV
ncbi:hypothetical protein BGZ80_011124 [Entomortierella chlamydospora]|uniref:Ion transport domain-containing protein n=1 Tax=Entomortierella chlamydospora TaxID=101097 RepID=A0A9P6MUY6_9FUNG|nr:hypothetical protein BGZ80_011124 [Entomortierella chlamydospora]